MSDEELRELFKAKTKGLERFSRQVVIELADMAEMSPKALAQRCERLGLALDGSWEWFEANGGISSRDIQKARDKVADRLRTLKGTPDGR